MKASRGDGEVGEGPDRVSRRRRVSPPPEEEDGGALTDLPSLETQDGGYEFGGHLDEGNGVVEIWTEKSGLKLAGPAPVITTFIGVAGCVGAGYLATKGVGIAPILAVLIAVVVLVAPILWRGHK